MKNLLVILLIFSSIANTQAQDKKKIEADKKSSTLVYSMKHPMHDWDAKSKDSKCIIVYNSGTQKIEAVAVIAPVKSFDSGNSNRDSHTIEVLEALKYPNITFSGANIQEDGNNITIKGNLTFHGVTKPLELKAKKTVSKSTLKVEGDFEINMEDYGVEPPGLMGIKANKEINLKYSMVFSL
ncbi:YceI family protein [Lacihabitans sp. LS3-19]|uniref:YceI family protein n=1 Tax=Lacihabitans sp. LS3-19 TaxID=2487335 RepID=UPI0020CE3B43|nr:YceI family protein [Lacihabitans sp. LS3-19]MCP9770393.1 YceI family protein [Lacihabitans sp. LS3-19]